jgi:hypothetical protein
MNKEEKKEYIKRLFELVLTGTKENCLIVETFIESLNLHDDFLTAAEKEIKMMRAKKSFIEFNAAFKNVSYLENLQTAGEIGVDIMNLKAFLSIYLKKEKPQLSKGQKLNQQN